MCKKYNPRIEVNSEGFFYFNEYGEIVIPTKEELEKYFGFKECTLKNQAGLDNSIGGFGNV